MTNLTLLALIAFLPVAVIMWYVYKKDHDPEPIRTILTTFLWGCVSVVPALIFETIFKSENPIVEYYLVIAFIEEFVKYSVIMLYVWKHKDFDDTFDAIVYCVSASLGFALIENFFYIFSEPEGLAIGLLRAITAIPGHTIFAIFMGFFVGKAKNHFMYQRDKQKWQSLIMALLVSIIIHGTYDLLCSINNTGIFILYLIFMDIFAVKLINKAAKEDRPIIIDLK